MNLAGLVRGAPAAATALVAITAGAALAPLTWHALGMAGSGEGAPRAVPGSGRADMPVPDVSAITAMAPFGAYTPQEEIPQAGAQETGLSLVLRGVMVAAAPQESAAFIARGSDLRAYGIGDTVVRGAVLSAVYSDHVELEVAGIIETLSFPDPKADSRNRAGVENMRARLSASARAPAPQGAAAMPADNAALSAEEVIEDYRQRIAGNPQTVLDGLGLEAGEQGYRIREDAPAMVRRAGLRPGDIVMRVNGETVGDVESDRGLYDRVAASGRARVEILRDGRTVTLSFPLY